MPDVLVILGSRSDAPVGEKAVQLLRRFGVSVEMLVDSAHRTPDRVKNLVLGSKAKIFVAIAGLSAALPGVVASITTKPVIGVPVSGKVNIDSILPSSRCLLAYRSPRWVLTWVITPPCSPSRCLR